MWLWSCLLPLSAVGPGENNSITSRYSFSDENIPTQSATTFIHISRKGDRSCFRNIIPECLSCSSLDCEVTKGPLRAKRDAVPKTKCFGEVSKLRCHQIFVTPARKKHTCIGLLETHEGFL